MTRRLSYGRWALVLICVGVCTLVCAPFCGARPQAQGERIINYHSDIEVETDGSMLVLETIQVESAGRQIRHGIYRDFPTRYTDPLGNRHVVGFNVLSATRDGAAEEFSVEDQSNGKRIYLGSGGYMLPPGIHTYTITYSTNRQLGFFADHDEIFWNVTGNGWIFPIERASATVRLPDKIPADSVQLSGYTGRQGSKARDLTAKLASDGGFDFDSTRPLMSFEGLTILLTWPKGYIAEPTQQQKIAYFLEDNRPALIAGGGLLVVLLYYLIVWAAVGRDPAPGTLMVLYEPPGFSPAAMRYLVHMGYDNKAFASALLSMAVKRYLKVAEQAGSYTLYRKQDDTRGLSPEEKIIAETLFGDGRHEFWLHNENHVLIKDAISSLKAFLKTSEQKTLFVTNSSYMIPAVAASVVATVAAVFYQGGPRVLMAAFICFWLTIWSLALAGMVIALGHMWEAAFADGHLKASAAGKAALTSLAVIPFLGGEVLGLTFLVLSTSLAVALALLASVSLHVLFHFLLKAPTRLGRTVLDKIEGFKMFLDEVEGDRINRVMPPEQTPQVFEKFLPYALALGVEHAWAKKFSLVLNGAGAAPGSNNYSPAWYSGPGWSSMGAAAFASSFGGSFSSAISSSSSAPGSSGGSGGGSGGGGGGGGGGGW